MIFNNTWLILSVSDIFTIIYENKVEVVPGIYEISMSGLITGLDNDNSSEIYPLTDKGSAIKDLSFKKEVVVKVIFLKPPYLDLKKKAY